MDLQAGESSNEPSSMASDKITRPTQQLWNINFRTIFSKRVLLACTSLILMSLFFHRAYTTYETYDNDVSWSCLASFKGVDR